MGVDVYVSSRAQATGVLLSFPDFLLELDERRVKHISQSTEHDGATSDSHSFFISLSGRDNIALVDIYLALRTQTKAKPTRFFCGATRTRQIFFRYD